MRARWVGSVAVVGLVGLAACVDLFHGTEFETLCTTSPNDPQCTGVTSDGAIDAPEESAPDVAPRPIPDFCAWSSNEARAQAERACARLDACVPGLRNTQLAECLVDAQLAYDCQANPNMRPRGNTEKVWGCLATATTCTEVEACVFPEGRIGCLSADGGGEACGPGASAAVHVHCDDNGNPSFEFCQLGGGICLAQAGGFAGCAPTATVCKDNTRDCAGGVASDCSAANTAPRGVDCREFGDQVCVKSATGPACQGKGGEACSFTDVKCEGSQAKACVGQREIAVDCVKLGLQCADQAAIDPPPTPYAPWRLCLADTTCDESPKCMGDKVSVCVRGASRSIDCNAAGVGACKAGHCTKP